MEMNKTEMMFDMCKKAHEHKDILIDKMAEAMYDKSVEITDRDLLMYMALKDICEDNIMEMQRENVWQPLNDQLRQADGIHTVYVDDKSHFMHDIKGHDLNKAMAHVIRYMDMMKASEPTKYATLLAEITA